MFWNLLRSEAMKLKKSRIWLLALISPALATLAGFTGNFDIAKNDWINPMFIMIQVHAVLFLPILTGVISAFVCRYEHQSGGWKQLIALPVTRVKVYLAKGTIVALFLAFTQVLFLTGWLAIGIANGYTDSFPIDTALKSILGGWLACLPLAALQLWVSTAWASFAAPLALNVIFTIPNMLVANSAKYGPFYPWAQPFLTMMPNTEGSFSVFYISPETLFFVIGGSFLVFLVGGLTYFRGKAI